MTHHEHPNHAPEPQARTPWYQTWTGLAGLGATSLAAVYLSLFHVDHVLDALPLLVLLLCPLMHLFMHGGHGHGGHGGNGDADRPTKGGLP
ncbi:DUF2933 domain-containing protein [Azospirillum sp. YIM DDC1]|uniref:DUF2933 domain-containing protein n=1 Tax=Azospirillum aestuarii TaxID=2802052 RepID=A0ABS1HSM8_9PROT|nr:DUF2933 domain-containing protein [Azospirillum aestuarii]MBK4717832.1 DUF2933 domain-containing protein [Azospirillum aestuarii]